MNISIPDTSGYYYDPSQKEHPVLLCWFPRLQLENMVNTQGVKEQILKDYPDGLDLEVSDEQFKRFGEKYALKMPYDAMEVLVNFEGFQRSGKVKTGEFITAKAMDEAIKGMKMRRQADDLRGKFELMAPPEVRKLISDKKGRFTPSAVQVQREFKQSRFMQKEFDNRLKEIKGLIDSQTPKKGPPGEKVFGKPKMTEGKSPVEFFFRFQQRQKEGR